MISWSLNLSNANHFLDYIEAACLEKTNFLDQEVGINKGLLNFYLPLFMKRTMDVVQILQGLSYKACPTASPNFAFVLFIPVLGTIIIQIDPFTKRDKLIYNGGFLNLGVLYCSQNTAKSIKIQ